MSYIDIIYHMRTIVTLTEEQVDALAELSESKKSSRAALIREAIDCYLEQFSTIDVSAFGLWKQDPVDSLEFEESIRNEWD